MNVQTMAPRRPKLFPPLALVNQPAGAQPPVLSGDELRRIVTAILG